MNKAKEENKKVKKGRQRAIKKMTKRMWNKKR